MNIERKRILPAVPFTVLGLMIVLAVPQSFIANGSLSRTLVRATGMKVDARMSGGNPVASFSDPFGDDRGCGSLTYPVHPSLAVPGTLDLVRYVVYEPAPGAYFAPGQMFWQLGVFFAEMMNGANTPLPFSQPVVHAYIDIDGADGGSVETLFPSAELIGFDTGHPWDYLVEIHGHRQTAVLYAANGGEPVPLETFAVPEMNAVFVRLPLSYGNLKRVLDGRPTHHYVLSGVYNGTAQGNFSPVKEKATRSEGGGAKSALTPRVFDYIAPSGVSQKDVLSSFDEATMTYAVLKPLTAGKGSGISIDPALLAAARDEARREAEAGKKETAKRLAEFPEAELSSAVTPPERKAELMKLKIDLLIGAGRPDEAERILGELSALAPGDSLVPVYEGGLTAMKAGAEPDLMEKMRLVDESFELLDRAVAGSSGDNRITALVWRANVFASVPEEVFGKNGAAYKDFREAARLCTENGNMRSAAEFLFSAGGCALRAGLALEADIAFTGAASLPEAPAWVRYELLKKGIPAGVSPSP